jgi:hypothetical protein
MEIKKGATVLQPTERRERPHYYCCFTAALLSTTLYIYMYIYVYIYVCVYMYIYIYIYIYICICMDV